MNATTLMHAARTLFAGTLLTLTAIPLAAATSSFDGATVTDGDIVDGDFVWMSTEFADINLVDAATVGVGSGQALAQTAQLYESPSGMVGHFWVDLSAFNLSQLAIGDTVTVSFAFKTETPADPDNPGFDRFRWGLFEGVTANSPGIGNVFSAGATASRGKINIYEEAYNDDESPRFFSGSSLLSDPTLAAGADTPFGGDDVTINAYLGNGEVHDLVITIVKTANGLDYTLDIDDGFMVYSVAVPLNLHTFTRFGSFQFWMRDASSPDAARGLAIDDFTVEVMRTDPTAMVASMFDGAMVDGNTVVDGDTVWTSSSASELLVTPANNAGFGSGDVLEQANVNYPEGGQVGYFHVDLSALGITNFRVGETVTVNFTYRASQPLDMDNPGFDRLRFGLFEEADGNSWGVGNIFSPGATASRGKVNLFRKDFNDEGDPRFFSNTAYVNDPSLVEGADTPFGGDDVTINGYLNNGDPHHIALTITKTPAGVHYVADIDAGKKVYMTTIPVFAYGFTHFSAFQFYMRAPESADSAMGLYLEDFMAAYHAVEATGDAMVMADFNNAQLDEETGEIIGAELSWQPVENANLVLSSEIDTGMGSTTGRVLHQLGEDFESEPSGSFATSLSDLGAVDLQVGDEITVRFRIRFPNGADADNPGWDRYRLGIFESTSSNTYGIGNSFSPGSSVSRAHISFFKETYDAEGNPGFLSKEDPHTFEDLIEGGDTPFAGDDVTVNAYLNNTEVHTYELHLVKVPDGIQVTTTLDDGVVSWGGLIPNSTYEFKRFKAFRFWLRAGTSPTSAQEFFVDDFVATYKSVGMPDDPFAAAVSGMMQADGSYVSPWFGRYVVNGAGWITSDLLGGLWTGSVENPFNMWMWSLVFEDWLWTADGAWPLLYAADADVWYFVFYTEELGTYLYNYETRMWAPLEL